MTGYIKDKKSDVNKKVKKNKNGVYLLIIMC